MTYFIGSALLPHPPIMLPEIGGNELVKIASTVNAVKKIATAAVAAAPETVVIISPHAPVFRDCVGISAAEKLTGSMREFGHPELSLTYNVDLELSEKIALICEEKSIPLKAVTEEFSSTAHIPLNIDKGSFVPLYYLHQAGFNGKIVHLSMGFIPYKQMMAFGIAVKNAIESTQKRTFVITSGDLSHRLLKGSPNGYSPNAKIFDQTIMSALPKLDSDTILSIDQQIIDEAGECGLRPIYFLLGTMQGVKSSPEYISYEGPFGVGYGTVLFLSEGNEKNAHSTEVILARNSLTHYLSTNKLLPLPDDIPQELSEKAGAFVSIKKFGQLRGCIGTIFPTQDNTAMEIINNAVSAGTQDPRFHPITIDEIDDLVFSVDILGTPEPTIKEDLDPQKYGVITAMDDGRRGLLLPMLEGIDTVEDQISIAKQKGRILPHEEPKLYRFTVTRYY